MLRQEGCGAIDLEERALERHRARVAVGESPGNKPCVAIASIATAPESRYARAALSSEPPVRIMSS